MEEMRNYPHIVEDFFSICKRFLKCRKSTFLSCNSLSEIMVLVVRAVGIEHREAAAKHSEFFIELLFVLKMALKEDRMGENAAISNPE